MRNTLDFKSLAAASLAQAESLLSSWIPDGHSLGNEYKGLNPRRADSTPGSFSVNLGTGAWADFSPAAGDHAKGGDLISLYAYINNVNNGEAFKVISKLVSPAAGRTTPKPRPDTRGEQLLVCPPDAPPCPTVRRCKVGDTWVEYPIAYTWAYRNAVGVLLFYVCRYQTPNGKEVLPLTLHKAHGELKWQWRAYPDPRPLYNLEKLAHAPQSDVIVVEGEKCAEALQAIIEGAGAAGKLVAVTWQGGGKATGKADWSTLTGRRVILWPDNDEAGSTAMQNIAGIISASDLRLLSIPDDKPAKWDVADAILEDHWGFPEIIAFIKANKTAITASDPGPDPEQAPAAQSEDIGEPADSVERPSAELSDAPFRCLGHDGDTCFYLPDGSGRVYEIPACSHNESTLTWIAPASYWEHNYHSKKGADYRAAREDLFHATKQRGIYNPKYIRGLGAWFDAGHSVLHLGDRLLVDGKEMAIHEFASKYIYESHDSMELEHCEPCAKEEANRLRGILEDVSWEKPIYALYVAGWTAIAPICGALKWRPHLWITGAAATGKTTVLEEIIGPCLGDWSLPVLSSTTGAAIRQQLKHNGVPVVFDEFDTDSFKGRSRAQEVLELARSASSTSRGKIYKGTQSGTAISYDIRSCFLMSSIHVVIDLQADASRITVAQLRKRLPTEQNKAHFAALLKKINETLTPEFCAAFRMRSVRMIPIIRQNAEVFAAAICQKLGNRRTGDRNGALLAGAYSLSSDNIITPDKAAKWIDTQDWSEQEEITNSSDEKTCLDTIMTSMIKITPSRSITVAEMLEIAKNDTGGGAGFDELAETAELNRMGIRVDKGEGIIYFADTHPRIDEMLKGTPYQGSYARIIGRMAGVVKKHTMRYTGCVKRATGIPWNAVFGEGEK